MSDRPLSMMWRLGPIIYGPTALYALGQGAVIPLFPVFASRLGANVATSALVAAALVIGQLIGNLPSGWLVVRFGERRTMIFASVFAMIGVVGMGLAPSLALLTASVFVVGLSAAAFALARHSFMTTRVPLHFRARALALVGGSFRLGTFVGPFVAAGLVALSGDPVSAIWFFAGCLAVIIVLLALGPDPESRIPVLGQAATPPDTGEPITGSIPIPGAHHRPGIFATMWLNRGVLSRLGFAASLLSASRATRMVVLPLWGVTIGLDPQTVALVVGIAGGLDFALFYASGQVMDRFGRLWAALPAMVLIGSGLIALSLTRDSAQAGMWFAMFAAVIGVGNGLSSGMLLTLGSDLAPKEDPANFLGSWRTLTDAGAASVPLLVAALTAVSSLALATGVMGAVALVGAVAFLRWIPRFVPRVR